MRRVTFAILITLLVLTGCATSQKVELYSVTGRPLPDPTYTLFDTSGKDLSVSFYYVAFKGQTDLDGSTQLQPKFLPMTTMHEFSVDTYKGVTVVVELWNEKEIPYFVMERSHIRFDNGQDTHIYREVAKSNLRYRTYDVKLPFRADVKDVTYALEVTDSDGMTVFRIVDFHYSLIGKGGGNHN